MACTPGPRCAVPLLKAPALPKAATTLTSRLAHAQAVSLRADLHAACAMQVGRQAQHAAAARAAWPGGQPSLFVHEAQVRGGLQVVVELRVRHRLHGHVGRQHLVRKQAVLQGREDARTHSRLTAQAKRLPSAVHDCVEHTAKARTERLAAMVGFVRG